MRFLNPLSRSKSQILSGQVCMVRIVVRFNEEDIPKSLFTSFLEGKERFLRDQMAAAIARTLGPDFHVESMTVGRGSIELLVIVATAYYAISRYKNFVESLELMVEQLRRVAADYFGRDPSSRLDVTATWSPAIALMTAAGQIEGQAPSVAPLVWYLMLTHAAMLTVLIWLLLHRIP